MYVLGGGLSEYPDENHLLLKKGKRGKFIRLLKIVPTNFCWNILKISIKKDNTNKVNCPKKLQYINQNLFKKIFFWVYNYKFWLINEKEAHTWNEKELLKKVLFKKSEFVKLCAEK